MSKKQKFLASINVNCYCGIILEHNGDDIHREIDLYTIWLEDIGFTESPGFGIWIWEGYAKYNVDHHSKEYDLEWIGNWREPTAIEWKKIMKRGKLWNYHPHNDKQQNI